MREELRQLRPLRWAGRITARHLLSHSAGLANPIPVRWVHPTDQPGPDPNVFLRGLLARHGRLRFEPGSRSSYSNLYRAWHPRDHVSARYVRRAPDGSIGPEAQIALYKVLARNPRF